MMSLKTKHPGIYEEFSKGKFVVQKTQKRFSMTGLDHNHEQENAAVKGDGGAVGLTENEAALRRWIDRTLVQIYRQQYLFKFEQLT